MAYQLRLSVRSAFSLAVIAALHVSAAQTVRYSGLQPDRFLASWVILSPIPAGRQDTPDEDQQKEAFSKDQLTSAGGEATVRPAPGDRVEIDGTTFTWRAVTSQEDVVDLGGGGELPAFSIAYAYAEIRADQPRSALLGIGSDDAVRVWLNGELIHENWTGRPVVADEDLVQVRFVQGVNRLLLKIQNIQRGWGFACRVLGPDALGTRLVVATRQGDIDIVRQLLEHGAPVNRRGPEGLTAIQLAHIQGDAELVELLASRGADRDEPLPPPETLVDRLFASLFKPDGPAAAVLVARDGRILFEKAYGLADIGNNVPATPETKFRIGSITKQFTSAAILKLREEGRISTDTRLSAFIPDYPRGDEVTIHHLLTHTSGIHSYTGKPDFVSTATLGTKTEEHINSFKNDPYDFDPGARYQYNNSGYFLLGYIIEKVSGQSYADYLRQTFFEPLGMRDTGVHEATTILKHEATGYSHVNGAFTKALNWDMSRAGAAGALYSTVRDLYRWNEALFSGRVLAAESLRDAFTPVVTREDDSSQPKEEGYGYGWAIESARGLRRISHSGGLHGFLSHLLRIPSEAFTVVVLINCSPAPPNAIPAALGEAVTEFYLHERMAPRARPKVSLAVSTNHLEAVTGRYAYPNSAVLTVTREGDKLYAQLTGQSRYQIFPESPTNYFWKVADAKVSFVLDESGKITAAIHQQGGQRFEAPRLEDIGGVTMDPAILDEYAGRYDYSGGAGALIMTITREGSRLFAQLTGQPKFEIFPGSETEFFWKAVEARVTFVRDEQGKVTRAVHHQGGRTLEAPRIP